MANANKAALTHKVEGLPWYRPVYSKLFLFSFIAPRVVMVAAPATLSSHSASRLALFIPIFAFLESARQELSFGILDFIIRDPERNLLAIRRILQQEGIIAATDGAQSPHSRKGARAYLYQIEPIKST
jgi:hypothetical protein